MATAVLLTLAISGSVPRAQAQAPRPQWKLNHQRKISGIPEQPSQTHPPLFAGTFQGQFKQCQFEHMEQLRYQQRCDYSYEQPQKPLPLLSSGSWEFEQQPQLWRRQQKLSPGHSSSLPFLLGSIG
ncbi:hypothetical protein B0T16DRAFT_455320 [Cercophora newfieldiana]|uniref:Uncharacterized protein n=1 Tax=Cercophora newfieldiana TaxID=92897 RepID=A0AA39YK54_9PEZI|nr:hypothetical protein B0T16DRAFT_455320 [Cercophora newfieldiana]